MITRTERNRRGELSHHEQMLEAEKQCVPCKLCGGAAKITDAGTGAGYYIRCENARSWSRRATGCVIDDQRLGGWAYNVMEWWNKLHGPTREQQIVRMADVLKECRWFKVPDGVPENKHLIWATNLWEAANRE